MLKRSIGLFGLVLIMSCSYAQDTEMLIEYSHKFKPNRLEKFSNPFFWSVTAECWADFDRDVATFRARVTKESGTFNGQKVKKGQILNVDVMKGQHMSMSAAGSAAIEITNQSNCP